MKNGFRRYGDTRNAAGFFLLVVLLLTSGCAEFGFPLQQPQPVEQAPPQPTRIPEPQAEQHGDALPPLDAVMIAHHRQCEAPAGRAAANDDTQQLRDLMKWLRRSCGISDATLQPQIAALKQLRKRYTWPDAYAAWLDEWRRTLARMQMLQQRAVMAEEAQATMVKRLRAIERDLTTRP
jgi:hypothetical protein